MAGAREDALLDDPRIGADFEHVEVVIGFEDQAIGLAEMDFNEFGHVAEIRTDGDFCAIGAESETNRVGGIMRDGEGVDVDVANDKALAGLDGLHSAKAFAKCIGHDALERGHGGFGNVERSFPEPQDLRKAVAVVRVFVGDENGVEMVDFSLNGSKASKGFTFAKASVDEDASGTRFQQSKIAGTARSQDGNTQTDWITPGWTARRLKAKPAKNRTLEIMAERCGIVNAEEAE